MSYKYKFAGMQSLQVPDLAGLREKLADVQILSDESLAAEIFRLYENPNEKSELLDWLDDIGENEVSEKLEKRTRTPVPLATHLLGEDSPRIERILALLRERSGPEGVDYGTEA